MVVRPWANNFHLWVSVPPLQNEGFGPGPWLSDCTFQCSKISQRCLRGHCKVCLCVRGTKREVMLGETERDRELETKRGKRREGGREGRKKREKEGKDRRGWETEDFFFIIIFKMLHMIDIQRRVDF